MISDDFREVRHRVRRLFCPSLALLCRSCFCLNVCVSLCAVLILRDGEWLGGGAWFGWISCALRGAGAAAAVNLGAACFVEHAWRAYAYSQGTGWSAGGRIFFSSSFGFKCDLSRRKRCAIF